MMIRHHVIDRFLDALYFAALDPFWIGRGLIFVLCQTFYELFSSKQLYIYTYALYFYF